MIMYVSHIFSSIYRISLTFPRFVVFLFIFSAFVIAGHILFGSKLKDFSTVQGSFAKSLEQVGEF